MHKLLPLALTLLAACSGSSDPAQLMRDGLAALNSGKPAEAYTLLDQAVLGMEPTDPHFVQAAVNRCRALAHTDADKAKSEFLALAGAHSSVIEEVDFEMVADALRSRKKFPQAIDVLAAGKQRYTESPRLQALIQQMGKEAGDSKDEASLAALRGLGYVGD